MATEHIGKLLIVEDDPGICELLKELFEEYFQIRMAHDGQSGYEAACEFKPDCIISDVMMPRLSGINMLKLIRSTPEIETTGVILLTMLSNDTNPIRDYGHLADLYFLKPFDGDELLASAIALVTMPKKVRPNRSESHVSVQ